MCCDRTLIVLLGLLASTVLSASTDGSEASPLDQQQPENGIETQHAEIVRHIDFLLGQGWSDAGIEPADQATDGEFLRRAYLDLNGVIPRVSEVRQFLHDDRANKRELLIDQLLHSPRYATHMATVWRNRIVPQSDEAANNREAVALLQEWLRTRFARNLRYDALVAGLLLATGSDELGPGLYFQANDLAPEKLAASVSDLFLGVQLQCAQCHDHPYSEWSQTDFWALAAFFAQVQAPPRRGMNVSYRLMDTNQGEVRLPQSEDIVPPKYPRSEMTVDTSLGSRRASLVLWLTSRDNHWFARAGVNWAWTHLFGIGLVDSVEESAVKESSINEQLLDDLADYFVDSGFDLQELIRTIASTRAYQLSSHDQSNAAKPELFARFLPKPLTPEQLYDSFLLLSPRAQPIQRSSDQADRRTPIALTDDPLRIEFVRQMREPPGPPTEFRAGTLQALMLMNGNATAELTAHQHGKLLGALTAPFMDDKHRIEALFLATLCRHPDPDELNMCQHALSAVALDDDRRRVMSDILWALINSTEFAFNQ